MCSIIFMLWRDAHMNAYQETLWKPIDILVYYLVLNATTSLWESRQVNPWTLVLLKPLESLISCVYYLLQLSWGCWCMQNSCMNFVAYWCIFQHIKMLWDIITIFCIDSWGFSINPLYFGYTLQYRKYLFCVLWRFRNLP
jgi:hypothetical protein